MRTRLLTLRGSDVADWGFGFNAGGTAYFDAGTWASGPDEGHDLGADDLDALDLAYPEELEAAEQARYHDMAEDYWERKSNWEDDL